METQQDVAASIDTELTVDDVAVENADTAAVENDDYDPSSFYDNEELAEAPENGEDAQDDDGEVIEPIAPPTSWKAEDKAEWDRLPRNVQETVTRREAERDQFLQSKAREAATVERRVQDEARSALAQIQRNSAAELQRYAEMFAPQTPDPRLLYTGDAQDALTYQQQEAAHRAALAQQQSLQQQAQQRAAEAQQIEEQQAQATREAEVERLQQALPDWFDPDKGPKLKQELQSIGAAMGYPAELMSEATAQDILALKYVSSIKAKADKYDALISKKMSAVSRARQLPRIAKPGTGAAQPSNDPVKLLYPND